jgi:hypothetical protein
MINRELANRARAVEAQKLLLAYEAARQHRSLKDTAIALQVDRKTITRLRNGSHSPNRKLWEALAEAYDKHYPSGYPEHIHGWLQKWRGLRYFGEEKYELALFICAIEPALKYELPLMGKTGRQFEAACAAFALATLSASKGFDCIEDERDLAKLRPERNSFDDDTEHYLAQAEELIAAHMEHADKAKPAALRLRWKIMVNRDVLAYRNNRPRPDLEKILKAGEALLEFEPYNWEMAWNCFNYAATLKDTAAIDRLWPALIELMPDLSRPDFRVPGNSYKRWTDDPDLVFAIQHLDLESTLFSHSPRNAE